MEIATWIAAKTGKDFVHLFGAHGLVRLEDHGDGVKITHWDSSLGPKPTEAALAAALAEPDPIPVPASVSRRQFFQAAAAGGLITQGEALAVLATGAIPAGMAAAIADLPAADQFAAKMAILGAQNFERANAILTALATEMGHSAADLDALFIAAATL